MNIKQKKDGTQLTVFIDGRIDTTTAPKLYDYLVAEMEGVMELTLDFTKVEYVSSAGLRVILFAEKTMKGKGGKMIVAHVNDDIMETFELTCFTSILTII